MWMVYFLIFAGAIILPLCCVEIFARTGNRVAFFDQYTTQVLKGIAICLVVCGHFMNGYGGGVTYFTPLGGIGVMIFVMLAAFGLNESWRAKGGAGWWRRRIITVFIPYALVQICLYWVTRDFSVPGFLLDILLLRPAYAYGWYLNYLFVWYILFYIVMKIPALQKHKLAVFGVISLVMFLTCDGLRAEQSLSFLCGIMLSELNQKEHRKHGLIAKYCNWKYGAILIVTGILFLAIKQIPLVRQAPTRIFYVVQLLIKFPCGLGLCFVVSDLLHILNLRFMNHVGGLSYEIYLTHGYVLCRVSDSIPGAITFIAVSVVMALLLSAVLKRTNSLSRKLLKV